MNEGNTLPKTYTKTALTKREKITASGTTEEMMEEEGADSFIIGRIIYINIILKYEIVD